MPVLRTLWALLIVLIKWVALPLLVLWVGYWIVVSAFGLWGKDPRPWVAERLRAIETRLSQGLVSGTTVLDPKFHLDQSHSARLTAVRANREARNHLVIAEALNAANERIALYDKGVSPTAHPYDTLSVGVFSKATRQLVAADVYYVTSIHPDKVEMFRTAAGTAKIIRAIPGTTYRFVAQIPSGEWSLPQVVIYRGRMQAPKEGEVDLWVP